MPNPIDQPFGARLAIWLLWLQGVYFFVTGVWPLVDIESFQWVTGPKTDLWLVRTVGVMITVVSLVLLLAAKRKNPSAEVKLLAIGSAAGLMAIDVFYVTLGVIAPIYLADAAAELLLIIAWGLASGLAPARARSHQQNQAAAY